MSVINTLVKCKKCGNESVVKQVYDLSKHTKAVILKKCEVCGI